MAKFYIIIARKIFFPEFWGARTPPSVYVPPPLSPTPMSLISVNCGCDVDSWCTEHGVFSCIVSHFYSVVASLTRKLCYRKDDRAMCPIHGCTENFRDSLTTPTATIPNIFTGFCSDRPSECSYII